MKSRSLAGFFLFIYLINLQVKTPGYYIIYKPYQVLTQFSPAHGKLTLKNIVDVPVDVYPVGRLDYDSEGLLILTNDAALNKQLLHPAHAHEREYYAQVEGLITETALAQLRKGVTIQVDGKPYHTKPCRAALCPAHPELPVRNPPIRYRIHIPDSWVRLTLTEGKNRQVRKMLAAAGFPVLRLVRFRIAGITAAGMQPGDMMTIDRTGLYRLLFGE
jgi:23S rRNA pseudouridine2457 synthase